MTGIALASHPATPDHAPTTAAATLTSHPARLLAGPWRAQVRLDLARSGVSAVHWTRAHWTESDLPDQAALRELIGRDWDRFALLRRGPRRELFAVSRLLLKHAAAAALQTEPEYLELGYSLYGRPFIQGCDQLDVSLSHSGGLILLGLTTVGAIGVDVEPVDRHLDFGGADRHLCTPPESAAVQELPAAGRGEALLRLWTLKEAYTKALGLGLRLPFDEFGFTLDEDAPVLLSADGDPFPDPAWRFTTAVIARSHRAALALRTDRPAPAPPGSAVARAGAESGSSVRP